MRKPANGEDHVDDLDSVDDLIAWMIDETSSAV